MLDIKTIFLLIVVINFTFGVTISLASASERISGLYHVSFANIAHGIGYLLFISAASYGSLFVWAGETCIAISISMWMAGIYKFLKIPPPSKTQLFLIAYVTFISFFYKDSKDARIIYNSSAYVCIELMVLYALSRFWRQIKGRGKYLILFAVLANMLILTYRVFFALLRSQDIKGLYSGDISQMVLYVSVLITVICFSVGFILMTKERTDYLNMELILKDGLTGLWNRRKIDEVAAYEMGRLKRYGTPVALAIIDIDNFKQVNDVYGHVVGDQILVKVSRVCQEQLRDTDVIGRWGGEELVVIFPNTGLSGLYNIANRLCEAVNHQVALPDRAVSVSIGVSLCLSTDTWSSWFNRADSALYDAKITGKNKVLFDAPILFDKNIPSIVWSDHLSMGVDDIDNDHFKLISLTNEWALYAQRDYSKAQLLNYIARLREAMLSHFTLEEGTLSGDHASLDRAEHHQRHRDLIARLDYLVNLFSRGNLELDAISQFLVYELCIEHILTEDKKVFSTVEIQAAS
ncbi:diguanylate cyclase [Dickeya lacustris]|uniref:diguanylate cyclase n=1 Tax=Dickeya lacustris TaxID=2259638 RepID=A0ABY8G9V9_9GAMM|nr:diguanylate cyclase [Dickeya lacustris]WFN56649.1 diguanylate cyclase [Dickeya lacustris]